MLIPVLNIRYESYISGMVENDYFFMGYKQM